MIRRVVRFVALTVAVAGAVAAVRALTTKRDPLPTTPTPSGKAWPPVTPSSEPATSSPSTEPEPAGVPVSDGSNWVKPTASGGCPDGYPIKAKMSSKIYHSPGQLNYQRTTPDRCYRDTAAAEGDGLRAAKR